MFILAQITAKLVDLGINVYFIHGMPKFRIIPETAIKLCRNIWLTFSDAAYYVPLLSVFGRYFPSYLGLFLGTGSDHRSSVWHHRIL
jgi:hypothetical protein